MATDRLDLLFHNHKRNIVGVCIMPHRGGVECDTTSNFNCAACGWCYDVEKKRKKKIRDKYENRS